MKKCLLLPVLFVCQLLHSQNIGIGTTNPQSTLDIKGNQRIGGTNKFIQYDSISGKITWTNSNLFVPAPQYLMQHSASAEGLYYGNAQLEYRNQIGNPAFFTNWNTGNGYFSGNLGIGITSPRAKLHILTGESGNPFPFSPLVVEGDNNSYINILTPAANESGVLFGNNFDAASGGLIYNSFDNLNGMQFRTNGNNTRMVLTSSGNLGIGTLNPTEKLEVAGNIKATTFKYATPKTCYYSVPGSAFRGENSGDSVTISLGYNYASMYSVLNGKRLIAPVQLPQNAVMQTMTVYLIDNSASANMQVTLYRKTITSNFFPDNIGTVASAGSTGVTTPYATPVNTFSFSNVVDNTTYSYLISVGSTNNWGGGIMAVVAVVISYTMSEPN